MGNSAGPGPLGFARRVERVFNTQLNVLALTEAGQTFQAPLSPINVDNSLFTYEIVHRTIKVKSSGLKSVTLFSNANEGAATADIVFLVEVSSLQDSGFTPLTSGLMKEYNVDGGSLQISTTLEMDKNLFYRVTLFNSDGGNVTYTTDTYSINGNDVIAPAFLLIMTT